MVLIFAKLMKERVGEVASAEQRRRLQKPHHAALCLRSGGLCRQTTPLFPPPLKKKKKKCEHFFISTLLVRAKASDNVPELQSEMQKASFPRQEPPAVTHAHTHAHDLSAAVMSTVSCSCESSLLFFYFLFFIYLFILNSSRLQRGVDGLQFHLSVCRLLGPLSWFVLVLRP